MKVAILRGTNLNKWEMQNYEPLFPDIDITGYVAGNGLFDTSKITFPVEGVASPITWAKKFPLGKTLLKILLGDTAHYFHLTKILKDCDIIHTAETYTAYTRQALQFKKHRPSVKVVVTVWENIPHSHESYPLERRNKITALANADHFLATSEKAKNALIAEGANPAKITVLFMGIDLDVFQPREKNISFMAKIGISESDTVIATIARSVKEKGIQDILTAARPLIEENRNLKILVIGNGPRHDYLINLSRNLGIRENCIFIKELSYQKIPLLHNIADIFVLASIPTKTWEEQFGMVLIESMACAKAVISTRSGSIPEIIADCGLLVPPENHLSLREAIFKLSENKALRTELGQKALRRARVLFDSRKVAENIKNIYLKISQNGK